MPGPYATVVDLAGYWRALSDGEQARATVLLAAAGDFIDEKPGSADFVPTALKWVSLEMVKRAMIGGDGVSSESQGMADITVQQQFVNPMGNLYLTPAEYRRLQGNPPPTGSIKPTNNARVPHYIWTHRGRYWPHEFFEARDGIEG